MIRLIRAEFRKNWKTKKFIIAILCFLCFMGCSYILDLQKGQQYHEEEALILHYEYSIESNLAEQYYIMLQEYTIDNEPDGMREQYEAWKELASLTYGYIYERQAPEYFGWDTLRMRKLECRKATLAVWESDFYNKEFEGSGQSLQELKNEVTYLSYLQKHDIKLQDSPYDPTLTNFIMQLFQNESMILLILIAAFFVIDQICQDFDNGSYKQIYMAPMKRTHIMAVKIINSFILIIISFVVALLIFACVPLLQYGFGSLQYPYMLGNQCITFLPLLVKVIPFMLLVLLFYMSIGVLVANIFRNTTNALLCMIAMIIFVYLSVQLFGLHMPALTWLPLFYLYPFDIIAQAYDYSTMCCVIICILFIIAIYILYMKKMEISDLEGSDT